MTLKFRTWSPNEHKAYIWDFETLDFLIDYDGSQKATDNANGCVDVQFKFDDDCVHDLWTGLVDKNGKEIYENDLIKYEGQDWVVTNKFGGWFIDLLDTSKHFRYEVLYGVAPLIETLGRKS